MTPGAPAVLRYRTLRSSKLTPARRPRPRIGAGVHSQAVLVAQQPSAKRESGSLARAPRTWKRGDEVLPPLHNLLHLQVVSEAELPGPPGGVGVHKAAVCGRRHRWVERLQEDQQLVQLHDGENQVHAVGEPGKRRGGGDGA